MLRLREANWEDGQVDELIDDFFVSKEDSQEQQETKMEAFIMKAYGVEEVCKYS